MTLILDVNSHGGPRLAEELDHKDRSEAGNRQRVSQCDATLSHSRLCAKACTRLHGAVAAEGAVVRDRLLLADSRCSSVRIFGPECIDDLLVKLLSGCLLRGPCRGL